MHKIFCNCGEYWKHLPKCRITIEDQPSFREGDTGEGIDFITLEDTTIEGDLTTEGDSGEKELRYSGNIDPENKNGLLFSGGRSWG